MESGMSLKEPPTPESEMRRISREALMKV